MNVSSLAAVLEQIALDLAVAPGVAVFIAEAAEHLHGGVPLLGGCVLVVGQDLVEERLKGPQDGVSQSSEQRTLRINLLSGRALQRP